MAFFTVSETAVASCLRRFLYARNLLELRGVYSVSPRERDVSMTWTYPATSSPSLTTGSAAFSTSLSCRSRTRLSVTPPAPPTTAISGGAGLSAGRNTAFTLPRATAGSTFSWSREPAGRYVPTREGGAAWRCTLTAKTFSCTI